MIFQLEVNYKVDRLLTGLNAQQKGATARWYSNKTSLYPDEITHLNKYTCLIDILGYIEEIIMLSKGFIISPKQKFLDRHEYYFT